VIIPYGIQRWPLTSKGKVTSVFATEIVGRLWANAKPICRKTLGYRKLSPRYKHAFEFLY
jgi:hypothetical protein